MLKKRFYSHILRYSVCFNTITNLHNLHGGKEKVKSGMQLWVILSELSEFYFVCILYISWIFHEDLVTGRRVFKHNIVSEIFYYFKFKNLSKIWEKYVFSGKNEILNSLRILLILQIFVLRKGPEYLYQRFDVLSK